MANYDNKFNEKADQFLRDIWGKRELGLPVPEIDWSKPFRHEDVAYLLRQYPYLQIMNIEPNFPAEIIPQFIRAPNGWVVHDYGDAMSSSPGQDLFGPGAPGELPVKFENSGEDEGGSGTHTFPGAGTIIKQAYDTAYVMVLLAMKKAWKGVHVIAGTHLMQWAAWMAAENHEFPLQGFEPDQEDQARRSRAIRLLGRTEPSIKSMPGLGRSR